MELVPVVLVYTGLIVACIACVSVIRPIHFLAIRTRAKAWKLLALALAGLATGFAWPSQEHRLPAAQVTLLDEFAPAYEFHEVHTIRVRAAPEKCYAAIREVTPEEIELFQTLTWVRRLGRPGAESIVNAPDHRSLIDTAVRTGFTMLADDGQRELVLGNVMGRPGPEWSAPVRSPEKFKHLKGPDVAKLTINFRVELT